MQVHAALLIAVNLGQDLRGAKSKDPLASASYLVVGCGHSGNWAGDCDFRRKAGRDGDGMKRGPRHQSIKVLAMGAVG